ncbi:MAG: glycosyl hydrolase family 28-related protein [Opitutaceae bacterium]|jgi:hypothetical protein
MKLLSLLRHVCVLTSAALAPLASAKVVFSHGFETYPAGANIQGQPVGDTIWTTAGVIATDLAVISTAQAHEGAKALVLADSNTANRPRASINLVNTGYISAPLAAGSVSFALREDTGDGSATDAFTINISNLSLSRGTGASFYFSVTGGGGATVPFGTHYTPGAWHVFRVDFDNVAKTTSLFIDDVVVATLSAPAANLAVTGITFGTFSSAGVTDKFYIDAVEVTQPGPAFAGSFESYTVGANIYGQVAGATTWTTAGVVAGSDLAIVSNTDAFDGTNSLLIADNTKSNRPRASLNFVDGGFIPAAASAGSIFFTLREDPADAGAVDAFTHNFGGITLSNNPATAKLALSVTGAPFSLSIPYHTNTYDYAAGQWNAFELLFDDVAKTASLYINGGYAGTVNAPLASTVDFTVSGATFGTYATSSIGDKFYIDAVYADFSGAPIVFDWRSSLYPVDWTPGYTDAAGHFLHDFSYAGYHRGEVAVPTIAGPIYNAVTTYGADPTGATDSTGAIQNAINAAGLAGGGVVYLPAGTYKVAPIGANAYALTLNKNNVVLRGAGATQTFLHNTNPAMRTKSVILVQAATSTDWYAGGSSALLTANLLTPTTTIPIASTAAYNVGDLVVIRNDLTQGFIDDIGMTGKSGWTAPGPNYPGRMLTFCRRVVSKTATTLTIDVPTRFPIKTRDNARVLKPTAPMLQEIGVEDLSIGMTETAGTLGDGDWNVAGTGGYNAHLSAAVRLIGAENCWVRRVNTYKPSGNATFHLLSNGIVVALSRLVTVESCDLRLAQYKGAGGNGYLFNVAGQESLYKDCRAEAGRHNLSIDMMYASGNVVLRLYDKQSQNDSDFHQFLSVSNLIDGVTCDGEMLETRYRGEVNNPTPGWTSAQSVFWNTTGLAYGNSTDGTSSKRVISSYQLNGDGYVIGTQGPANSVTSSDFVEGVGQAARLIPQSLYEDQLARRLAP